ncbi:MAG: LysR substrate-binding domain-containing protein [Aquidulcibacter sp.]|uniref:LysR substrate-binding domain-containing protein n=1 Tax=Aquidulcibacter sp. TaxID=2052990 RepID=UPI0022C71DF5|nr:LysR substrate-binding domain-containing protein [Aquidulcibacter sp.]MCE2892186.1 LysR substrate-binding domain-containing protein [Hyphomonadaceae bacterium]MCZ8210255.1 LysR substrate-binding domain-containing protein [Aquidulcibacter sp.]
MHFSVTYRFYAEFTCYHFSFSDRNEIYCLDRSDFLMPDRFPKISLDALVVIDAIARHASFTRAADELNKVPSAVSYTVLQLEQKLGVLLFDRSNRRICLTPVGRELLEEGRRLLRLASDMERRLIGRSKGWETELRIVVDTIFGTQLLFPLVEAFDTLESNTRITLREEALSGCWDAITNNRADLAVTGLGSMGNPSGGGFDIDVIGRLNFDFAVAPNHPLAMLANRQDEPVTDDELRPYRAVSVADSSLTRSTATFGLLTGQNTLTVASIRDKLAAQIAGLGVGFLPSFLAESEFSAGRLVKLCVLQPRPAATFAVVHRRGNLGNAGKWFKYQMLAKPSLFPGLYS